MDKELSGYIHAGEEFGDKTRRDAAAGSVSLLFTLRVCGRKEDKMGTGCDKFSKRAAAGHQAENTMRHTGLQSNIKQTISA